jgi:heat shock protein HslJ
MALMAIAVITSLAGTSWTVADAPRQFIDFRPQHISGNAGCNNFSGQYNQRGSAMSVGTLATTRMGCKPETMAQEFKFLQSLEHSTAFEITEKQLTLKNAKGDVLMKLNRKDVG